MATIPRREVSASRQSCSPPPPSADRSDRAVAGGPGQVATSA